MLFTPRYSLLFLFVAFSIPYLARADWTPPDNLPYTCKGHLYIDGTPDTCFYAMGYGVFVPEHESGAIYEPECLPFDDGEQMSYQFLVQREGSFDEFRHDICWDQPITTCSSGYEYVSNGARDECVLCTAGADCPGGFMERETADKVPSTPPFCPFGYQLKVNGEPDTCTRCPAGSGCVFGIKTACTIQGQNYQPHDGQSVCWSCPSGSQPGPFVNEIKGHDNATTCSVDPGKYFYNGVLAQPSLFDNFVRVGTCRAGHYCPGPSGEIFECEKGKFAPAGQSQCEFCGTGEYASDDHTYCTHCPAGSYCPGGDHPIPCPATTTNTGGASTDSECTACPAGSYCLGGTAAATCPAGTYSAAGVDTCTVCPGTTIPDVTHVYCMECPFGKRCEIGIAKTNGTIEGIAAGGLLLIIIIFFLTRSCIRRRKLAAARQMTLSPHTVSEYVPGGKSDSTIMIHDMGVVEMTYMLHSECSVNSLSAASDEPIPPPCTPYTELAFKVPLDCSECSSAAGAPPLDEPEMMEIMSPNRANIFSIDASDLEEL